MTAMDEFEFYQKLNESSAPVKQEEPEAPGEQANSTGSETPPEEEPPIPTGLSALGEEIAAADRKEKEEAQKLADFMLREDDEPDTKSSKRRRGAQERDADGKLEDRKTPLTTFGHSSRPRRSVNYASIERGDEAQAQSLVTEFGSGKKRPKRTRDELDGNYEQEQELNSNRGRKKSKPSQHSKYLPPGASSNSTQISARTMMEVRTPEEEFKAIVPKATDERPSIEQRSIGVGLDQNPAIQRSSGGFRRFIGYLSNDSVIELIKAVDRRFVATTDDGSKKDSQERLLLKSLRHVYNTMSHTYRRDWEYAARMDVYESRMFVMDLCMPMSEIPVKDVTREKLTPHGAGVHLNCCSAKPLLSSMCETIEHFLQNHDIVHLFGCDFCYKVYPSKYELTKHDCKEFTEYMTQLILKQTPLTLDAANMYLCCSQCGLWLSAKGTTAGSRSWTFFATSLVNHSCRTLVPVVVYLRKGLKDDGKNIRFNFQLMASLDIGFPMSCSECETEEFKSLAEAEEHFKKNHKVYSCTKCNKQFGTEFLFRHHKELHLSHSVQFANYLTYTATFHPPPNSGRVTHIGFQSEIPVIGGFTGSELQAMETLENKKSEYVEPNQDTMRKKVFRWKRQKTKKENRGSSDSQFSYESGESSGEEEFQKRLRTESSSSSSSSTHSGSDSDDVTSNRKRRKKEKKVRGDLGYDHIDRNEMFERSTSEKEARKRLEKMFNSRVFLSRERLLEPEECLKMLEESRTARLAPIQCTLADEIVAATIKTVNLPASNCIDPLKDIMLVNKIFYYCPKCKLIFSKAISEHMEKCAVQEEALIEVYHAASGPQAGVRCIYPECKMHLCSVVSLKTHLIKTHSTEAFITENVLSNIQMMDSFFQNRYDRSMSFLAKNFTALQNDQRTYQARMTDIDCFLPFNGLLDPKMQQQRAQVPSPTSIRNGGGPPASLIRQPYIPNNQRPYMLPPALKMSSRIKPYRIPRTSRWYSCAWCDREFEALEGFVDHLCRLHCHPCTFCGRAFSSANTKRTHVCSRQFAEPRQPGTALSGECPSCPEIHPVESIYVHMLRRHFSTIDYLLATGELLPTASRISVRNQYPAGYPAQPVKRLYEPPKAISPFRQLQPTLADPRLGDYRLKQIKIGSGPVYGVDLKDLTAREPPVGSFTLTPANPRSIDTRLMCYLCEMTFDSERELVVHLEEHPEKWAQCPFCAQKIESHFDLQKHLLQRHVVKISGQLCCAFCHESHNRFMPSHLLFRCKRMSKCTICSQNSKDPSSNGIHMQRNHAHLLRRFQCTFCVTMFTSVGEYYEHQCTGGNGRVYSCACSPQKFFNSPNGYCDHFDSLHILRNKCKLCQHESASQEQMVQHRASHMRSGMKKQQDPHRKLFIIVRTLFPKLDSAYMKWLHGGPLPASYDNCDRSDKNYLMGDMGEITTTRIQSYAAPPPTLFDVLEGPSARQQHQRFVPIQPRVNQVNQPTTSSADDVIMLSDDDDDDCVVFEAEVPSNGHKSSASASPSQVDRQVRVEQEQTGYGGAQQPGYVAEEDEPELEVAEGEGSPRGGEPVVKEIVDENGDDELAVVAEVENATGTLPHSVAAGREKKFKCKKCSMSFYTKHSLDAHDREHKQDAGAQFCEATYGIPVITKAAWLCRNCCVAFENQHKYQSHMAIHGDTSHTCVHCSGIAFNTAAIQNHMGAHQDKKVQYACGSCLLKFSSDLALYDHLYLAHTTSLFYFCKVCGFGSTNADMVYQHVVVHSGHPYTIAQRFGACPAQLLNYDPTDEKDFRAKVLQKAITLHTPSDCSHRSLLLQSDTLVSCKTCHCTQAWFNYLAFNKHTEETGFPNFKVIDTPTDERREFALYTHLSDKNAQNMVRFGNMRHGNAQTITSNYPNQNQQRPGNAYRPIIETRPVMQQRMVLQRPNGPAPVVSMTANGARVIRPAIPTNSTAMFALQQQQQFQQQQQGRRILVRNTRPDQQTLFSQLNAVVPPQARNHSAVSTKCNFRQCDRMLTSDFDRQLHSMHSSDNTWFCRQCGHSSKTELDLFLHYMKEHLTPAFMKHQATGFKANVFQLKCPIPSCTAAEFQSPKAFEKHIRSEHSAILPFEATCCDARFATKDLADKHDKKHDEYQEMNGTDASCCPICGSLDMWSLPKDQRTECLQSHVIRHGLDYRSSCRMCLKQFPADVDQSQVIDHIREQHALVQPNGAITCRLCTIAGMNEDNFADHCRQKHVFHLLVKSALSVRGELVVSTGEEYDNYVGLKSSRRISTSSQISSAASTPSSSVGSAPPALEPQVPVPARAPQPQPSTVSAAGGGNAALLTIAQAIGEAPVQEQQQEQEVNNDTAEVLTLD